MPKVKMGGVKGFKGLTCWRNLEQAKNIHRELTTEASTLGRTPYPCGSLRQQATQNVAYVQSAFEGTR